MNLKVRWALSIAGFSDADVAEIDKALPAVARLLDEVKEIQPIIAKLSPDIFAVIPAAKIIIAYAQKE